MSDEFESIHLYGQHSEHDEAFIVGTRGALITLRKVIDAALESNQETVDVFASDGEGYDLIVKCVSEEEMDLKPLPYRYLDK